MNEGGRGGEGEEELTPDDWLLSYYESEANLELGL